jgi:hypothetical protein
MSAVGRISRSVIRPTIATRVLREPRPFRYRLGRQRHQLRPEQPQGAQQTAYIEAQAIALAQVINGLQHSGARHLIVVGQQESFGNAED